MRAKRPGANRNRGETTQGKTTRYPFGTIHVSAELPSSHTTFSPYHMVYYGLNNTNSLKLPGLKMSALISVYEWIVLYWDSQQLHTRLVTRPVAVRKLSEFINTSI